ncbi:uncharacterized protein Pof [Calliphora vicina]|uniref:uncharacterized protein Pof n=1 Tax=Calliphora vicina TaxID=7373 RepID=UPI00325B7423
MNKYNNNNNFSRTGDTSKRFNKRPRYGTNNSGPKYKHQNSSGYQYSHNRNNIAADSYPYNQYDNNPRNNFGISPKRPNHNHRQNNKQSPPYLHKPAVSACLSPSSSSFSAATQNLLNLPPTQTKLTPELASAAIAQKIKQLPQQCTPATSDNSNCYGFGYNSFYPNRYNADLIATASNQTFGSSDGMSSYMWETIKSTPPPKLPQQQPPLPEQGRPILPPLPSDDKMPYLPPPPIPATILTSLSSAEVDHEENNKSNDQKSAANTIVKIKTKRKSISVRYKLHKCWSEEDSLLALKAEETNVRKLQTDIILVLRFPDPEISREIVKCYSPDIESVHFQLNFAPRYCFVHLKPGSDVEKTIENLSKIPFGTGFLSVEIKQIPHKVCSTKLNEIDPYTLYVGNLPNTIASKTLKQHFPGAARIDIGFAQRIKYTRYAFIRYQNVQKAIEAYKRMLNAEIDGRALSIRFRRLTPTHGDNKDAENPDDILSETRATSVDNSTIFSQTCAESTESMDHLGEPTPADIVGYNSNVAPKNSVKITTDFDNNTGDSKPQAETVESVESHISSNEPLLATVNNSDQRSSTAENSSTEINNVTKTASSTENTSITKDNSNTPVVNIKPDPDIDPDDIVIRDNAISSRVEGTNDTIKQEEEVAIYNEFFAAPINQNDSSKANTGNDTVSLHSTTDETDTMSSLSVNSLGEFLQTCHRPQTQANNTEEMGPPPTKRHKVSGDVLQDTIKKETLENENIVTEARMETVKQEPVQINENSNVSDKNMPLKDSTNQTVHRRRATVQAAIVGNNTTNPQSNTNNNEDLVPSTALFFTSQIQNTLANTVNECDYDEFYDTSINPSSQTSASATNIKKEPLDISRRKSTSENVKNVQQKEADISERVNVAAISNAIDEDDLVPSQNLLGSYRPLRSEIKHEMEHDDLFSVPINNRNNLNEDSNLDNHWNNTESAINIYSQSDKSGKTSEGLKSTMSLKDTDDDVIIISDNISRRPQLINSNTSILSNLFLRRHTDLVTFKPKPIAVTTTNRGVSKLLYRDNLDKLYEQLDADSDNDL